MHIVILSFLTKCYFLLRFPYRNTPQVLLGILQYVCFLVIDVCVCCYSCTEQLLWNNIMTPCSAVVFIYPSRLLFGYIFLSFLIFSFSRQFTFLVRQLYFNPATVKMLSNLKVLVIAVLLKMIMKRRFSIIQVRFNNFWRDFYGIRHYYLHFFLIFSTSRNWVCFGFLL